MAAKGVRYLPVILPSKVTLADLRASTLGASLQSLDPGRIVIGYEAYFKRLVAQYLSLDGAFKEFVTRTGRRTNFKHDGHWNVTGHQLAATTLSKFFIE